MWGPETIINHHLLHDSSRDKVAELMIIQIRSADACWLFDISA